MFAGKVVAAACFSNSAGTGTSLCPNGAASQTGDGAAEATTAACINGGGNLCTHGSHVAAIAAGRNSNVQPGEPVSGVAREAALYPVQVFTRFSDDATCGAGAAPCLRASTSDTIGALEHLYGNRNAGGRTLAAINMSLGSDLSATACDGDPEKPVIDLLRAAGVLTVISAGKRGQPQPGRASRLHLQRGDGRRHHQDRHRRGLFQHGPDGGSAGAGRSERRHALHVRRRQSRHPFRGSAAAAGSGTAFYACMSGTSMAAPHVAGAIAALRSACPSASADAIEAALKTTGIVIADSRAGGVSSKPRIRVDLAAQALCGAGPNLVSAVLPGSRSVAVGAPASAFATVLNAGTTTATGCGLAMSSSPSIPATFTYQTTDPSTNAPTGTPNTGADIAPGAGQSFVFALTADAPFAPTDVAIVATCGNSAPPPQIAGVNTLLVSASATPTPDIVALAAGTMPGYVDVALAPGGGRAAFAVSTSNVGAGGAITVSADTGAAALPVAATLCQTDTQARCLAPVAPAVTAVIAANATPTFSVFVECAGLVPDDPARNRCVRALSRRRRGDARPHQPRNPHALTHHTRI
jgi:hypothetical protein